MFLHDYAPELVQELKHGVTLATTRVSCAYYQELSVFDDVLIRMSSTAITPSRLTMLFQYFRISERGEEQLVAEGEQELACVRRTGDHVEPVPLPEALREAVESYIAQ
jgi:enediyne biosynthesis thioesterase